jgi:hypothetical protein
MAWLDFEKFLISGFGHAFGLDGEHDQAVSAYSTAARLFKG